MNYDETYNFVKNLKFDSPSGIISSGGENLYVLRPSKVPGSLRQKYDPEKNFQIWLKDGKREFKPNHMRVLIDLNLRVRSRPDMKIPLLKAFDKIFYGEDVSLSLGNLVNEKFQHYLNPLSVIGHCAQLFLIEQELNYTAESKFEPKTLFFQGWVREFIDSPKEIDNMCMSVARFQPPAAKYVAKENKKSPKHVPNLPELWYIDGFNSMFEI